MTLHGRGWSDRISVTGVMYDRCVYFLNHIFIPTNETALLKYNNQSNFKTCLKKSIKLLEHERNFVLSDWILWFQNGCNKLYNNQIFKTCLKKSIKLPENEIHFASNAWISWFQQIWNKVVINYHNKFSYCGDLKSCCFFPVC